MADATTVLFAELSANPQPLIEGFKRAEQATGAWATAAQRHMQTAQASFGDLRFDIVTTKARAEQIKLIELQHQLDVARAAGETKTVRALTEEIALLTKIRQLRSAGFSQADASSAAKGAAASIAAAREAAELREVASARREKLVGNPGEAVASAFGRVRLGVIEEGATKIPLFGSALESLGVVGLSTAAALAAVAISAEEAKKSLEYADDIDRTSKALGVTTTQLQEFDYATSGTSVGIAKGREALQSFNEVFGKYSAGLASAKAGKFLDALGFTPESARELGSTNEALEKTLEALAKIQNPQQRAALATQLGLKDFLVILAEGQEGVENFVKSMHQAQDAGAVISPDEIKRAAELNDKLEQVEHTISVELKKAFIELGPVILAAAQLVERIAAGVANLAESLAGIEHVGRGRAAAAASEALDNRNFFYSTGLAGKIDPKTGVASGGALFGLGSLGYNNNQRNYDQANKRIADIDAEGKIKPADGRPGADLSKPAKAKTVEDKTAEYDKAAVDAYQAALKSVSEALAGLTTDIEAHAEFEKQAVDADFTRKIADLDKREIDIRKAKIDAHAQAQLALIETAKAEEAIAAAAKKEKIDRDAAAALRQQQLSDAKEALDLEGRSRTAQAAVIPGNEGRVEAELQNFRDQQLEAIRAEEAKLNLRLKSQGGDLTDEQVSKRLDDYRATQSKELIAKRVSVVGASDPLYNIGHPLTSVKDDLKSVEAEGLRSLGDGLASIATGTKTVKDAFHDMAQSIIADLIKIAVQREIEAPLANFLFGAQSGVGDITKTGGSVGLLGLLGSLITGGAHATGTDLARGGLSLVGERGPELVNLATGSQVIPNSTLDGLTRMGVPSVASGGDLHVHVDVSGANGDAAVASIARQAALEGTAQAIAYTNGRFSQASSRQRNALGSRR